MGAVLYELEEYKRSIGCLKKATELNPQHSLSSLTLIHALSQESKWHVAISELRRFLKHNSENVNPHIELLTELSENSKNFSTLEQAAIKKLIKELK